MVRDGTGKKVRGETRNTTREIARMAAGLTKAGLTVSHTEFDPITGHIIYHTTSANGEKRVVEGDDWEKFIRDEKAKRQDRPH
jgi:hypothetical protein